MIRSPRSLHGFGTFLSTKAKKHAVLLCLLAILFSIVFFSKTSLQASVAVGPDADTSGESSRTCTSDGTLFEGVQSVDDAVDIFKTRTSQIVEERLKLLQTPSEWTCPKDGTESETSPMPMLEGLALELPGWSYEFESPLGFGRVRKPKPVRFELFSSILMEFERQYECHLMHMQDEALAIVVQNKDHPDSAQFCCAAGACVLADDTVSCGGAPTDDQLCGGLCSVTLTYEGLNRRVQTMYQRTAAERIRARLAVERTMMTLRSFEVNYGYARDLMCYARASLDLRNELSLLADATSCMPKIWDALTSLHDRKP